MHLTAAGALHLGANILAYFGPICSYDIFLTLGLLFAVCLSAGEFLINSQVFIAQFYETKTFSETLTCLLYQNKNIEQRSM